ncbi:ester cyclase [Actinomycetospora lutea]|uniref:ester cyclase n=1 Tax=Actinomycetospora lutea TaxID=663604 RepID=UPI002365B7E2|nr:ester cyclase [Actinomycetospora lutea]MDD7936996.1 ester cyclase [Actinomycetospora lutea]
MSTTTSGIRNEEALATAIDRWNAGDLDGYLDLYTDDVLLHGFAPEPLDKTAARAFYEGIFAAFPGNRIERHETFADGDRLTSRFTLTGRHDGDFMGVPATGREIAMPGITILHFRDGRCAERWTCSDMLGLLVQVGAVPPPA